MAGRVDQKWAAPSAAITPELDTQHLRRFYLEHFRVVFYSVSILNSAASSVNLLSFLITVFWVLNISFKLFRSRDLLEQSSRLLVAKGFAAVVTCLLLLRYAMNSKFVTDFSRQNSANAALSYLNLVTKSDFSTLVFNGLYFIVVTVYISEKGGVAAQEPPQPSLAARADHREDSPPRRSSAHAQRNTHPQAGRVLSKSVFRQKTHEPARVLSNHPPRPSALGLRPVPEPAPESPREPGSSVLSESLASKQHVCIGREQHSLSSDNPSEQSEQPELSRGDSLHTRQSSQFRRWDCRSRDAQSSASTKSVTKLRPEDYSDKRFRRLRGAVRVGVSAVQLFLEAHLLECFAVVVVVCSVLLRNLAGVLIVLLVTV